MLEISTDIPQVTLKYKKTDDLALTIAPVNPDGTPFVIENFDPVIEISYNGALLLTLENEDFTWVENDLVLKVGLSIFQSMSCLKNYQFRFFDRASQSTLMQGPFKVVL